MKSRHGGRWRIWACCGVGAWTLDLVDKTEDTRSGELVALQIQEIHARSIAKCLAKGLQSSIANEVVVKAQLLDGRVLSDCIG
jgi:hypothetical protein